MTTSSQPEGIGFSRLVVNDWRQFDVVDLSFHDRLTVLTGENGTGKTTLINILARHFGWTAQFLGVPQRRSTSWIVDGTSEEITSKSIGFIQYSDSQRAEIQVSSQTTAELNMHILNQRAVAGVFVGSHRTTPSYSKLDTIPAGFSKSQTILNEYVQNLMQSQRSTYSPKQPNTAMKEAMVAAAIFGSQTEYIEQNLEAARVWETFQTILKEVLPISFGFVKLTVRAPEILVVTLRGEFLIDAVSGGVSSIIQLAWQLLLQSIDQPRFTACLDEPENHLHPSLQRSLLPGLLRAFPQIRFIVATHSPFVVTSVQQSNVYVLTGGDVASVEGRVSSTLLDYANKAATADETLRRVLGLSSTIPLWAEQALSDQLRRFSEGSPTPAALLALQQGMQTIGLGNQFLAAISTLVTDDNAPTY